MRLFISIMISCLFFSFQSGYTQSGDKKNDEEKYFQKGVTSYIKRDYKIATKEFLKTLEINSNNEKAKLYMKKSHNKYWKSATLFFEGINYFTSGEYDNAEKKFKKSLLVNPLNKRAVYYLKLCYIPKIIIKPNYRIFRTSLSDNKFLINIDTHLTISNWIDRWEFRIVDSNNKVIKKVTGEDIPPVEIEWNLKDNNNDICSLNQVKYYMLLTSIYGRTIKSEIKTIRLVNDKIVLKKKLSSLKGSKVIKFTMSAGVLFDYDSDVLKYTAKEMLISLIKFLKNNLKYKVKISGYTDNIGSAKYNIDLSRRRALSVKNYLTEKGINKNRIKIFGYGKAHPVATNKTDKGRAKNRRVEFKLVLSD